MKGLLKPSQAPSPIRRGKAARRPRRSVCPTLTSDMVLESRQLLSAGEFFQGTVTAGGAVQPGATVELLSADGSTVLGQATSDASGHYLLDDSSVNAALLPAGIQPGVTYLLKELAPVGFINKTATATAEFDKASVIDEATVQVALAPGSAQITAQSLIDGSVQMLGLNGGLNVEWLGSIGFTISPDINGGTTSFVSNCANVNQSVSLGTTFAITMQSSRTFFPIHAGNIGYLFDKYGTIPKDSTLGAALQLAIWKLEFDPIADLSHADFTTGHIVFPTVFGSTDPNLLSTAQGLIAESAGKDGLALVLAYGGDSNGGQSQLATRQFDFDNALFDPSLDPGDTATIGFWAGNNGQALLKSLNGGPTATALATWLSGNFPNLFPTSLIGTTNTSVASYFKTIKNVSGTPKLEAQIMAVAFAAYVTDSQLAGGNYAATYGFNISNFGTGAVSVNVGTSGTALGLANGTIVSIFALLKDTDALATNGKLFWGNTTKRGAAITVFDTINTTGDIV